MSRDSAARTQQPAGDNVQALHSRVNALEAELVKMRASAREAAQRARRAGHEAQMAQIQANSAEEELRKVHASTSWRITAPMRSAVRAALSVRRFARDPSWSVLKSKGMTLARDVARRSTLARKLAFWVRDHHPQLWARIAHLAAPRFAGTQTISVTRWRNGSVSRRNYAELVSARAPHCDGTVIDSFLDARVSGVDSRKLATRLVEICESTDAAHDASASAR